MPSFRRRAAGDGQAVRADRGFLHAAQGDRGVLAEGLGHAHRFVQRLAARDDAVDQAPAFGVLGADIFAEVEHLVGDAGRDHARQHDIGEMGALAALGFRQAQLRVFGGDADVAGEREFQPPATAVPFNAAMVGLIVS